MTYLGYHALSITLVLTFYAAVIYAFTGKKANSKLIASANRAIYAVFGLVTFSSIALFYALYTRDFQIEYVASYTNRSLSWFYTGAAFWAGQAGSLLFWAWLLTIFALIVLLQNKKRNPDLMPYTMAVMSVTMFFFTYLLVFKSNPFAHNIFTPEDGKGLNPLLQNLEMVFHPPSLYVGFVGLTVPFAFAIAALLTRRLDERWINSIRRWTLFSWLFLTIGNILGMQWAYVELGWGGYWAWDPVENSSLLPWLTGTAFLHCIIVQERKGMLKIWNISLVTLTFALTIFGTFVTRSGLISSVHAFGVSDLGPLFLGFLAVILVGAAFLLFSRAKLLRGSRELGSWTSKESSFLVNNLLFAALAAGVFIGTILPTITEFINNEKMTVGADFFNRLAIPIGIIIFLLIGVCTLLSWGKTSLGKLVRNFFIPGIITLPAMVVLYLIGVKTFLPILALGVMIFATTVTLWEYGRGVYIRKSSSGLSLLAAVANLIGRNKRRYGGYIVHLGVLMMFLGIIGSSAFTSEVTDTIKKGESIEVGSYRLVFQGISEAHESDMHIDAANFEIHRKGEVIGTIKSEKHIHANFQPATEIGIRTTLKEDLYVILANYNKNSDVATVNVLVIPLVLWMWIGGGVMVIGTLIAISPRLNNR